MLRAVKFVLNTRSIVLKFKPKYDQKKNKVWNLCGYCNRDFAGNKDTRLSISGFCIFVMGCLVSCKSCGKKNVTLSSTKDK